MTQEFEIQGSRALTKRAAAAWSAIGLLALTATATAAAPDQGTQLEEITVTAQREVEDVQKVPIAVVAITPSAAIEAGAFRTDQLAELVPGVQMGHEIDSATTFIRGVGPNSNGTGEESSVAAYLDDLYIPDGDAAIFALNGISSIDVLKGPQGTLFGRNATGGVVQVHTKDPQSDPSADVTVGYANYNTVSGNVYATGKVLDGLNANIAAYINDQRDGWGRNVVTGQPAFTAEDWGVRSKWVWTPADATRVLLSAGYMYTRGEVGLGFNQIPGFVAAGGHGYCPGEGGVDRNPQSSPVAFACPGPPGTGFVGWYNTADIRNDVSVNKHSIFELRLDQDFSFAKLVSITGWQNVTGYAQFNQEGSVYGDIVTFLNQRDRNFSQELQLISPDSAAYAKRFHWIVGAFYMIDNAGYPDAQLAGIAEGFPTAFVPSSFFLDLNDNVRTTSEAIYGQATVLVAPDTHLTVGARYTVDKRLFTGGVLFSAAVPGVGGLPLCIAAPLACPTTAATPGAEDRWPMGTYRIALDHEFNEDVMAYLSWNRGVKSGQFDTFGTAAGGPANNPPVNPEVLTSVEGGIKSEWLDHRVQVNVSAFHYDVSNLQFAVIIAGGTKLINAASAQVNGGELSFKAVPVQHLTLTSGLSVLYGHYGSFANAPAYFPPNAYYAGSQIATPACTPNGSYTCNASGLDMIRAPHFGANFAADYHIPSSIGDFALNANWSYTGAFWWFADQSIAQPVVNLVNASVKWSSPKSRFDVRLWGANLTAAKYYSFGSESIGYGEQFSPSPPRTYGLNLGLHY